MKADFSRSVWWNSEGNQIQLLYLSLEIFYTVSDPFDLFADGLWENWCISEGCDTKFFRSYIKGFSSTAMDASVELIVTSHKKTF